MSMPYWGSKSELLEVIGLARWAKFTLLWRSFQWIRPWKYDKMRAGKLRGRAVLMP
ncbi:hypothetical protein [Olivibacter sp. XZL3]|uniref:hypothetical protein n=1 Tax=Olivibacter sp. XZL3 TaxID=1735116 RepID=UPI001980C5B1|nr:hypothetical protein [Olivibacter sp. XZL3]